MALRLVKASAEYENLIVNMLEEWIEYNNNHVSANHSPMAIFKNDYHDFTSYISNLDYIKAEEGKVPSSTFFCLDEERNIMIGAVNIRHYLNDSLLQFGGHIGDGIRPSERRKGYATKMIALALEECKALGIHKVLMVCDKNNTGSAKSIQNNGGILENEIQNEGKTEQRYWINID
ncbi:GNAT family N-acetyltransferase [Faecalicatena orotica]|uniref:Putative acetyltransferase n=1 Tax=Faecalicatena orotica TaxID=1544 RepID=A0A2Y9C5B6_9FIRM|nr:GNAT family N-acetyltransferase [Faecalicatena orotica]PWJ29545.1 putative acetyltransferase [Faecalicatena orotica]SSA56000.1 Predicted acetyltransferase [Faecalicatena orotica]